MPAKQPVFSKSICLFLRDLTRNNNTVWMHANRDRYRAELVEPFRAMLDRFGPAARKLNRRFSVTGRVGVNFSRIKRDIRFARDKTPYRPQMYLFFSEPGDDGSQLYIGASPDLITCGFRIYGRARISPLVRFGRPRGAEHSAWVARQQRKLGGGYQSYWYSSEKGEWTRHAGWPTKPQEWKKLQGWIVRKKFSPSAAARPAFENEVCKIFRQTYPLFSFAGSSDWKP